MRKLLFLFAFMLALGAPKGFAQSSVPAAAGQCNVTNGTGGWTLAACGSGSSSVTSPVLLAVSAYGAVADATGAVGVGTNNTTAIQNCINAVEAESPALTPAQGCLLDKPSLYRITAPIVINKSGVQLWGVQSGAWSINTSNQLIGKGPASTLVIDSATLDAVCVNCSGSVGSPVSFNVLKNFTIIRTQADTGASTGACKNAAGSGIGAAGINLQYAGGWMIDGVWSEDSDCPFYFQNAGAYGTGYMQNSGVLWSANGFNPTTSVYGIVVNGANSAESFRLRDSFVQTLYPGFSGVQSVGFFATGANLNDIMISRFETGFVTYGEYIQSIGAGTIQDSSDIHLLETINDSYFIAGTVINGLAQANGCAVEINGGWDATFATGAAGVEVLNSCGVSVSNVEFGNNGSQGYGVLADVASNLTINGNLFNNQSTASVFLETVSDASVGNNVFSGKSGNTQTMILGTSVTRSIFEGNSMGGFASTGISLDSGSSNNTFTGVKAIDPANITTQVSNAGSNNTFDGVGGLIQRQTLASTATTVTFSSIPSTYTNLHLVGSFQEGGGGGNLEMQFNGDTAAHYGYASLFTSSNTPSGLNISPTATPIVIIGTSGSLSLDVPNYTSTTFGNTYWSSQGGMFASNQDGFWTGTAPVTSIKLFDSAGASFSVGSSFSLYGLN